LRRLRRKSELIPQGLPIRVAGASPAGFYPGAYGIQEAITMGKSKNLIGKLAVITDKNSMYYNEWGTIAFVDEQYYIAIADSKTCQPMFDRDQFKICRKDFRK
jgi:hypothetical protein